jgi:cytochrome P450
MTSRHAPVRDWATDFDHADPAWAADPYPIWEDLRRRCPVAHTGRYGGAWLPVTHDLIREVAYDSEHFTSRSVVVSERRPGPGDLPAPIGIAPPITSDPPYHKLARRMLLPAFGRKPVAGLEPFTRRLCRELLAATEGRVSFDAAVEYAQHIPVRVIVGFLGFPVEDAGIFRRFIRQVIQDVDVTAEERQTMRTELDDYIGVQIDDHIARPRDDLTSFLLQAEIDGARLPREHIRGTMILLMIAGIDTTWSAIGACLWHLARHPGDRYRLAREPGLIDAGVEELLAPTRRSRWPAWSPRTSTSTAISSGRATGCCCRSPPPTGTRARSRTPAASSSTGRITAMPPSAWASTAAWASTWPAWNCESPCRNGWPGTRTSSWPTPARSPGRAARSAARAACRSASLIPLVATSGIRSSTATRRSACSRCAAEFRVDAGFAAAPACVPSTATDKRNRSNPR